MTKQRSQQPRLYKLDDGDAVRGVPRRPFTVSVPEELYQAVSITATIQRTSRSAVVAQILQRYFETID
jgi:hypothetical protein